ncbi:MAG: DUF2631 domain-containing protein [Pseudonocardiaceae bacterium]|nr:DUF2631 domain-containing protein [Pseudonocardiaceae bacterium]
MVADSQPGKAVQRVDPHEEPSVEWGWHGHFPKATRIAGIITTLVMVAFLIGNHESNVENLWLIGIAVAMIGGLAYQRARERTPWRR